jgi:hypothetical protein
MEIVYCALKGINISLREFNDNENLKLQQSDFEYKKVFKLSSIQVLKREFFERNKISIIEEMQERRNTNLRPK